MTVTDVDVRALLPGPRLPGQPPVRVGEAVAEVVLDSSLEAVVEVRSWTDEPRRREVPAPRTAPRAAAAPAPTVAPAAAAPAAAASRRRSTLVDHLLTLGALLGLVMVGVTVTATVTGLRPLVVKSGSMEPTIATGGLVLVREVPASQIRVGDVVAVERPDRTRVTHRVVTVVQQGATAELVLKGDANEDPDPVPVTVTTASEMVYSAPWLGRVSAFLTSPRGGFVLGSIITGVVLTVLRRRPA